MQLIQARKHIKQNTNSVVVYRRLHSDREEWARQLERKEQELNSLREKIQTHIHALNSSESKLNAVENEVRKYYIIITMFMK